MIRAIARFVGPPMRSLAFIPARFLRVGRFTIGVGNPVADFSATFRSFTQTENSPRFPGVTLVSMPLSCLMSAAARVARGR
jgi:hypothetical protein